MKNEAIAPAKEPVAPPANFPAFVEAEKLLERMTEFTKETSLRAYDYFLARGNEFGMHLDDWLKAEMDILRPTPIEITENKDSINVRAAVPGFKPEEIEISIKDALLIMSGESRIEEKKEDEKVHLSEFRSNRFCRQMTLPSEVETDGVQAKLKDGILNLTLKKKATEDASKIAVIAA